MNVPDVSQLGTNRVPLMKLTSRFLRPTVKSIKMRKSTRLFDACSPCR